jgi:hypothetical protein
LAATFICEQFFGNMNAVKAVAPHRGATGRSALVFDLHELPEFFECNLTPGLGSADSYVSSTAGKK